MYFNLQTGEIGLKFPAGVMTLHLDQKKLFLTHPVGGVVLREISPRETIQLADFLEHATEHHEVCELSFLGYEFVLEEELHQKRILSISSGHHAVAINLPVTIFRGIAAFLRQSSHSPTQVN